MEIKVLTNIHKANDDIAARSQALLDSNGVFCLNVMASTGAGKTTLLLAMIRRLREKFRLGVIEGDVSSTVDSEKIAKEGIPVLQINTGGGCHLDANQLSGAYPEMPLSDLDLLFIENVGNLICTAGYQLGEHKRIVIASVHEGDDKPYKYPNMFTVVDAIVVSKTDLIPHMNYSLEEFTRAVRAINPSVPIFPVSATTGEGMEAWCEWLEKESAG